MVLWDGGRGVEADVPTNSTLCPFDFLDITELLYFLNALTSESHGIDDTRFTAIVKKSANRHADCRKLLVFLGFLPRHTIWVKVNESWGTEFFMLFSCSKLSLV